MTLEESLRTLGIRTDATDQEIRQAYLDLVNVWHPDRFQGNARLQQMAEERLRALNEAYSVLKSRPEPPPRPAGPEPPGAGGSREQRGAGQASYAGSAQTGPSPSPPPRRARTRIPKLHLGKLSYAVVVLLICAFPLWAGFRILAWFRIPVLDLDRLQVHALDLQPQITAPSRILDVSGDVRTAVDTLAEWARGDVIDLWKPLSHHLSAGAAVQTIAQNAPLQPPARTVKGHPARTHAGPAVVPENGADLLAAQSFSGAGEIQLVNHTRFEALMILLRADTPARAVYVKPGCSAAMRGIGLGIYRLRIEAGTGLDAGRLRFENPTTPSSAGPFQFFELTSASGTTGQHYTVALEP